MDELPFHRFRVFNALKFFQLFRLDLYALITVVLNFETYPLGKI